MDYLHLSPHSSQIWTLPASTLGAATSWPQLLAGLLPCASAAALPDTVPGSCCPSAPSPKLPAGPFPSPHAQLSPSPCVPPSPSLPAPVMPFPRAAATPCSFDTQVAHLNCLPLGFSKGGKVAVRSKKPKRNLLPAKTLYRHKLRSG